MKLKVELLFLFGTPVKKKLADLLGMKAKLRSTSRIKRLQTTGRRWMQRARRQKEVKENHTLKNAREPNKAMLAKKEKRNARKLLINMEIKKRTSRS